MSIIKPFLGFSQSSINFKQSMFTNSINISYKQWRLASRPSYAINCLQYLAKIISLSSFKNIDLTRRKFELTSLWNHIDSISSIHKTKFILVKESKDKDKDWGCSLPKRAAFKVSSIKGQKSEGLKWQAQGFTKEGIILTKGRDLVPLKAQMARHMWENGGKGIGMGTEYGLTAKGIVTMVSGSKASVMVKEYTYPMVYMDLLSKVVSRRFFQLQKRRMGKISMVQRGQIRRRF